MSLKFLRIDGALDHALTATAAARRQ